MNSGNVRIHNSALAGLVAEIERGIAMIAMMDDDDYAADRNGESSIGAHIRHNLDFVNAALRGIAIGRVDYNNRSRDILIETDREYAMREMSFVRDRLGR